MNGRMYYHPLGMIGSVSRICDLLQLHRTQNGIDKSPVVDRDGTRCSKQSKAEQRKNRDERHPQDAGRDIDT
jgi:hypothetical protein